MELSNKTKLSELGHVPADWNILPIEEVAEIKNGLTYSPSNVSDNGTLVLRSSNIQNDRLSFANNVFVNCDVPEKHKVEEGDILICVRNGSRNLIGKCAFIDKKADGEAFGAFMAVLRSDISDYLIWQFRSSIMQQQINEHLGATINQITNGSLKAFKVILPSSTKERHVIAEALSDADALIASLEKLIDKRRELFLTCLKNSAQPYLEHENFDDNWRLEKFKNIAHLKTIRQQTLNNPSASFCVDLDNIEQGSGRIISFADMSKIDTQRFAYQSGDILFGRLRPYLKKFWMANKDGVCSTEIWPLNASESIDQGYLYFLVQTDNFLEAANMSFGTHMPRADWKIVSGSNFVIPKDIDKQRETASILFDLENQINREQDKLNKAKKIKAGMMQELLTGRTRLI